MDHELLAGHSPIPLGARGSRGLALAELGCAVRDESVAGELQSIRHEASWLDYRGLVQRARALESGDSP
jgi:hypothetical protein